MSTPPHSLCTRRFNHFPNHKQLCLQQINFQLQSFAVQPYLQIAFYTEHCDTLHLVSYFNIPGRLPPPFSRTSANLADLIPALHGREIRTSHRVVVLQTTTDTSRTCTSITTHQASAYACTGATATAIRIRGRRQSQGHVLCQAPAIL